MIVVKMMPQMVLFQAIQKPRFHRKMVDRVMNRVVADVTGNEASPNGRRRVSGNQKEQPVKQDRQGDAYRRRHHKPFRVVRIIVVNAMNDEVQLFSEPRTWLVVKKVTMNDVFEQGPGGQTDHEQLSDGCDRQSHSAMREINTRRDEG